MDEIDRETRTLFHQPDRRLAEVQDRMATASPSEKREIQRGYYREVRAEAEAAGEGRKYADRRDMMNNGRPDRPIGMLGPTVDEVKARTETPTAKASRGRLFAIGWEPKRA